MDRKFMKELFIVAERENNGTDLPSNKI